MKLINDIQKFIDINNSIIREIINLVNQDFLSKISNSSLISEEKSEEIYLLERKRESENFKPNVNHDNIFQKEKTFLKINSSKLENIRQRNESRYAINEPLLDSINYKINNFKEALSESSNNLKQEENNNKPKLIIDDKEGNLINNSSTINDPLGKLKYFNVKKNILLIADVPFIYRLFKFQKR